MSYPPRPTEQRFFAKVVQDGECWRWTGAASPLGYGAFHSTGKFGAVMRAHRWAFEYLRAEIPDELVLDHLCRNPWCVNPWHLDPVTHAENKARGENAAALRDKSLARTHCFRGHELPAAQISADGKVRRRCRTCINSARNAARRLTKESAL